MGRRNTHQSWFVLLKKQLKVVRITPRFFILGWELNHLAHRTVGICEKFEICEKRDSVILVTLDGKFSQQTVCIQLLQSHSGASEHQCSLQWKGSDKKHWREVVYHYIISSASAYKPKLLKSCQQMKLSKCLQPQGRAYTSSCVEVNGIVCHDKYYFSFRLCSFPYIYALSFCSCVPVWFGCRIPKV